MHLVGVSLFLYLSMQDYQSIHDEAIGYGEKRSGQLNRQGVNNQEKSNIG